MITLSQLFYTVILLVPGFVSIYLSNALTPSKKLDSFTSTVLSVTFSLIIHALYTVGFAVANLSNVNLIMADLKTGSPSRMDLVVLLLYVIGLLIIAFITGLLLAWFRDSAALERIGKKLGFKSPSTHEHVWDEIVYEMSLNQKSPIVLISFDNIQFAGYIIRASRDVNSYDRKEVVLSKVQYREMSGQEWVQYPSESAVYLNLSDAKSISIVNASALL